MGPLLLKATLNASAVFDLSQLLIHHRGAVGGPSLLFQGLQVRQQIVNLIRVELEFRHGRMAGLNAFGK